MDEAPRQAVTIHVRGRVQGVFYRASACAMAESLGLSGWVRNEPDGSVLIEASGPTKALSAFVDWARRGPEHARVDDLDVRWRDPEGAAGEEGFRIRR